MKQRNRLHELEPNVVGVVVVKREGRPGGDRDALEERELRELTAIAFR
jgi:hypothetical protein